jgi:deazaflavin-dependent oxidoreductase (nitroreductase family)
MGASEAGNDSPIDDLKTFNRNLIEEFRANAGKVTGMFAEVPLLLLTTTGAKSGKAYTTPLVYSEDGGRMVIIASMAGAPNNPAWYHNLLANPIATIEVGADTYEVQATEVKGEERDRLFAQQAELMPVFSGYAKKTSRVIPVFVLDRL